MIEKVFMLLWIFLVYSFSGWILETIFSAIKQKKFANRGIINGPFCVIYGFGAIFITVFTQDLQGIWLFIGSVILATLVEWIAGHLVEKWYHERWWDYKSLKWNLDGYISVPTSCIWGILGVIIIKWGNTLLFGIYTIIPSFIMKLIILVFTVLIVIDGLATMIILSGKSHNTDRWKATDAWMDSISEKLKVKICKAVEERIYKAYPQKTKVKEQIQHPEIFAYGCSFYKVTLLFFIGAFLGDIIETIFCRITMGVWMSRSSVVWGAFSIVWGLAIAAATALLYRYRDSSEGFLFCMGTFLGGAYEYICSVFTEIVFGTVFWDYSSIPFNLGGRINLLYCFFWGIAAVVWFKKGYPSISSLIEKIPKRIGKITTWLLISFMIANIFMSSAALMRYNERNNGEIADSDFEEWIDRHFDNERMKRIYPNAIKVSP